MQRRAVDLTLRREARTLRQAVNMVKEELGLPEGAVSLDLGMELIISRFTAPGDLVCDPLLLGRKESALAAAKQQRRFVGADHDASRLEAVVR